MMPFVARFPSRVSPPRMRFSLLLVALAGHLLPAAARAQVSFTGTAGTGNFGSQAIGSASAALALSFSISSGTTVGSIAVVTTGVAGLDFADAAGNTCTAQKYASATACAVNVTFTPMAAGLRLGAAVFFSKAGNTGTVLASVPVYGVGTGPQIAYGPGTATVLAEVISREGLQDPTSVAVDAAGDLFITDDDPDGVGYRVVKVTASTGTPTAASPTANGEALYLPSCIVVDGAGDLFIGDFYQRVVEVPAGSGAATAISPTVNGIPLNYPVGLAVDGAGDLFIGDHLNNRVVEVPAGGGAAIAIDPTVNGKGLDDPHGLALDGAGDLFIADLANNRVVEVPAGGGAAIAISPAVNGEGLYDPTGVAVDGAGDLFIADQVNDRLVEVPAGAGTPVALSPAVDGVGLNQVGAVTVDGGGDLFIVDRSDADINQIVVVNRSEAPALKFPTVTVAGSTDTADGAQTVQIVNIGNETLALTDLSYPEDFSEASGDSNCTVPTSLSAGQECAVSVEFTPQNGGALSESVTLSDNALNVTGAQQSIAVSGTGRIVDTPSVLTSPAPGGVLAGPAATFSWPTVLGATWYDLWLGSAGAGSNNIYDSGAKTANSVSVTGLPTNGETIYARLLTSFGETDLRADFTYTAAARAALASPAPGGTLSGPSVTFTWTPGTGAAGYSLWLGSTGAGSDNLYNSGTTTATSAAVSSLPIDGATVYARLFTNFNGVQVYADYTYGSAAQAVMTLARPDAVLPGPTATFSWTAGTGATGYALWLGTTGVGSNNVYDSGAKTANSVSVTGLPTNGETIYARLFTAFNGVEVHTDYTYTATAQAALTSPAPGSTFTGPSATFTWTTATGATWYDLWLGSTGVGSNNVYDSGAKTVTTVSATALPTNGETIYARLFTAFNGVEVHADYTYTADTQAALTSPAPGSTLTGPSVTFTWTTAAGATWYDLWLGTTGVGSNNLGGSGATTATSATFGALPTNGETIYARLFTNFNGVEVHTDYTYTAQ